MKLLFHMKNQVWREEVPKYTAAALFPWSRGQMVASKLWQRIKQFVDDKSFEIGIAAFAALLIWELMPREVRLDKSGDNSPSISEAEWVSEEIRALRESYGFIYREYSRIANKKQVSCLVKDSMSERDSTSFAYDVVMARYENLCNVFDKIENQANINASQLVNGYISRADELYHFSLLEDTSERRVGPFFSLPECQRYQDLLAGIGEKVIVCRPYDIWYQELLFPTA
ncbi:MAG: hypothetical protein JJU25_07640 [Halomonas sp.]|nr:hypothetical protein [Halomonas sp.]MCC5882492.1 hypothetical protein [Halomonas sp.]